jgi:hypothetical protein
MAGIICRVRFAHEQGKRVISDNLAREICSRIESMLDLDFGETHRSESKSGKQVHAGLRSAVARWIRIAERRAAWQVVSCSRVRELSSIVICLFDDVFPLACFRAS